MIESANEREERPAESRDDAVGAVGAVADRAIEAYRRATKEIERLRMETKEIARLRADAETLRQKNTQARRLTKRAVWASKAALAKAEAAEERARKAEERAREVEAGLAEANERAERAEELLRDRESKRPANLTRSSVSRGAERDAVASARPAKAVAEWLPESADTPRPAFERFSQGADRRPID